MKLVAFLIIVSVAVTAAHHDGEHFGHCSVRGKHVRGHICFKQNGTLTADFHVTGVKANSEVKVHIHSKPVTSTACKHAGSRFQGSHGNLGTMQAGSNCVIHEAGRELDGLSLSGDTSILGKSVFVHLGHNLGNACCTVRSITEDAYNRMVAMGVANAHQNACPQ